MNISLNSHSDYVMVAKMLILSHKDEGLFHQLVNKLFEANKPLAAMRLDEISLTNEEIKSIRQSNSLLWAILEKEPNNKELEHLVHSFCDVCTVAEHWNSGKGE